MLQTFWEEVYVFHFKFRIVVRWIFLRRSFHSFDVVPNYFWISLHSTDFLNVVVALLTNMSFVKDSVSVAIENDYICFPIEPSDYNPVTKVLFELCFHVLVSIRFSFRVTHKSLHFANQITGHKTNNLNKSICSFCFCFRQLMVQFYSSFGYLYIRHTP